MQHVAFPQTDRPSILNRLKYRDDQACVALFQMLETNLSCLVWTPRYARPNIMHIRHANRRQDQTLGWL